MHFLIQNKKDWSVWHTSLNAWMSGTSPSPIKTSNPFWISSTAGTKIGTKIGPSRKTQTYLILSRTFPLIIATLSKTARGLYRERVTCTPLPSAIKTTHSSFETQRSVRSLLSVVDGWRVMVEEKQRLVWVCSDWSKSEGERHQTVTWLFKGNRFQINCHSARSLTGTVVVDVWLCVNKYFYELFLDILVLCDLK